MVHLPIEGENPVSGELLLCASPDGNIRLVLRIHDETLGMIRTKMGYISQPTELGTIYSRKELQEISEVCRYRGLYRYMDGARLGYAYVMKGTIWICRRSPPSATLFTSAARRSVLVRGGSRPAS